MTRPLSVVHSHWNHFYENFSYSSGDFYKLLEERIAKKEYPNVRMKTVLFTQFTAFLSGDRLYLRVSNSEGLLFDICAAPYGTDFFVSWWFGTRVSAFDEFLYKMPIIGPYLKSKTYYELDTEAIFSESVKHSVLQCLDDITKDKVAKPLSELERIPQKASSKK